MKKRRAKGQKVLRHLLFFSFFLALDLALLHPFDKLRAPPSQFIISPSVSPGHKK